MRVYIRRINHYGERKSCMELQAWLITVMACHLVSRYFTTDMSNDITYEAFVIVKKKYKL